MNRPNQTPPSPHHLQDYLQSFVPTSLAEPTPPHKLLRTSFDLKHLCAGFLNSEQTLLSFFRILARLESDKYCQFRERFWRLYLDAGFISQCWLVLAPRAAMVACDDFGIKPHQFAHLQKNRRLDDKQAVLLMRLDHLVIAEWSHNGKCRFWNHNNLNAPNLLQRNYTREQLSDFPDYTQQHYFSAKGLWQKDAATWISSKAQIPILV